MAYSYTSSTVTRALIEAKRRGVDVQLVADEDNNAKSQYARAALSALVNAGVPVRLNGRYAIHHDKVIVVDAATVQTGSFNYSSAAANKNSENALVVWNNPTLARRYLAHWQSRFDAGEPYRPRY
jgi:phosphatidylserine/phosphatidylglycerophosphate/cardiolipin synthase-like enzyme